MQTEDFIMKKILIATTALVACSVAGGAQASEKIKLDLGGYSKWWVVGAQQKGSYKASQAGFQPIGVDIKGDNEIFFSGETTLDNGLTVGILVELEAGGNTDTRASTAANTDVIDKANVYVSGGFGKVIIGTEANGTVLMHNMAPDAAGNWGSDGILTGGWAIVQPAGWTQGGLGTRTTTELDTDDNAEKITYVSPTFNGFTVGGSYIPNANPLNEDSRGVSAASAQGYGVSAMYAGTIGEVDVKANVGTIWYALQRANNASGTTWNPHVGYNREWAVGTQLTYAGFTLGGSYRSIHDSEASNSTVSSDGNVWDAGLAYAWGNYAVSIAYLHTQEKGQITVGGSNKMDTYQASGKYSMGPGVDALASVGYQKYDGETAGATQDNKGWAAMTGLSLAF